MNDSEKVTVSKVRREISEKVKPVNTLVAAYRTVEKNNSFISPSGPELKYSG